MDPLTADFLGAIARWLLTVVMGYLVAHHVISEEQGATFAVGFAHKLAVSSPLLLPLAWGLYRRYRDRIKFLTALESSPGVSEKEIKQTIKNGMGAPLSAVLLACVLGAGAFSLPACAATQPPAGTYSDVGLKAFNADQLLKDVQALSETAINLNAMQGKEHLKDRDTALVRDFALSAGAGLLAYGNGQGSLGVVVAAFDELSRKLSAEAALNDKLRFVLALVAANIHRIPVQ